VIKLLNALRIIQIKDQKEIQLPREIKKKQAA